MSLKNNYMILRHGESVANVAHRIVSEPATGRMRYGLTALGHQQVHDACQLHENVIRDVDCILSSDFLRAMESARIVAEYCQCDLRVRTELRERFFGTLEGESSQRYVEVWEEDRVNPYNTIHGVESTTDVAQRLRSLMGYLEREYEHMTFLLVSHGDPLQIFETIMMDLPPHLHRERDPLGNAELRLTGKELTHV